MTQNNKATLKKKKSSNPKKNKEEFFKIQLEHSKIKSQIVSQYFFAWAKIVSNQPKGEKIAYIDLFSGPGVYDDKDKTKSTPILILENAIRDPKMCERLVTVFNDSEIKHTVALQSNILAIPDIQKLTNKPYVIKNTIDEGTAARFKKLTLMPTLAFIDPFGYKGLSMELVKAFLKDWGCDCIFFFNYKRVNMGINNRFVEKHIEALLGVQSLADLRIKLIGATPKQREKEIITALIQTLKANLANHVQCFKFAHSKRTSHYLIFASKHPLGYGIIKEIMAKHCIVDADGVPTYEYNSDPAKNQYNLFTSGLKELEQLLLKDYKGKTITMKDLYHKHHLGKDYIEKNYKDVIKKMEQEGKITLNPPASMRKKIKGILSVGENVFINFP